SSRRRHTRFSRDWSSDVCSSDLEAFVPAPFDQNLPAASSDPVNIAVFSRLGFFGKPGGQLFLYAFLISVAASLQRAKPASRRFEIGRAPCRERGTVAVVGGAIKA